MSAKHTIFPPGRSSGGQSQNGDDEDLYTGQPCPPGFGEFDPSQPDPSGQDSPQQNPSLQDQAPAGQPQADRQHGPRCTAKGHAAYAAHEHEPPAARPKAGPLGGLFGGAAQGTGLGAPGGMFAEGHPPPDAAGESQCDPLSIIPDDRLAEVCRERLCTTCPVKKEAEDAHLRALADLDNARKRLAREREEQVRFAAEAVLGDILPSLDNLDLALQHGGATESCKDFVVGVEMTKKLLQDALAKHGLTRTGAIGEEFNPALHEAVGMVDAPDVPDNHVSALLSSGYTLNGRLLRPARVVVSKKS